MLRTVLLVYNKTVRNSLVIDYDKSITSFALIRTVLLVYSCVCFRGFIKIGLNDGDNYDQITFFIDDKIWQYIPLLPNMHSVEAKVVFKLLQSHSRFS